MKSKWERQQYILNELRVNRQVTVNALSVRFGISPLTVRRDLAELESRGELKRAYRGAIPHDGPGKASPYAAKGLQDGEAAIVHYAANLAQNGDAIYIGPGKLTMLLARQVRGRMHGMVVTNSMQIVNELNPMESKVDVVMIGGVVNRQHLITDGPIAEIGLSQLRVRWAFVSAETIQRENDGMDRCVEECFFRSVADISRNVVLLARVTEIDRALPTHIAPFASNVIVISEKSTGQRMVEEFQSACIQLPIAQ